MSQIFNPIRGKGTKDTWGHREVFGGSEFSSKRPKIEMLSEGVENPAVVLPNGTTGDTSLIDHSADLRSDRAPIRITYYIPQPQVGGGFARATTDDDDDNPRFEDDDDDHNDRW
eukprot:CAMPEP_0172415792 /NCGR_PEP_ID=MMETSP1064-20121228/2239_1 /TAXON_ID=202472 /ORGANISM="Aulacoseira subarctica , Strain CCAP 1002/5" /LENGTH=113 /DNA_ID=CAMNT_0013153033 /DNA_START=1034 /DNA_END=1375 /DNA_ORIENTATION=+